MNEHEELADLKAQQARLERELGFVSVRLARLERRLKASPTDHPRSSENYSASPNAPDEPTVASETPQTLSHALPNPAPYPTSLEVPPVISESPEQATPAPLTPAQQHQPTASMPHPRTAVHDGALFASRRPSKPPEPPLPDQPSLELRLGTYWAPRVGIVVLLTGLVFIGNLAYQKLGPLGKVLLLYAASGALLVAGAWWHRTAKEALRNYAQVLFAGGLAALYFTTYGAHHLETLRVIESAWLDGVLLLACAGFIVWTADRWKSEILALFGVGLAYYSCVMTKVGSFTLYSNLLLAVTAVVFLVRNRWVTLSFGSLLATYAAYAFWRFFHGGHWQWASPAEGLWLGTYFLFSYWAVFTAAVFLSKEEKFAGENRVAFLTMNNGAMFALFILTMLQVTTGGFWKFCLAYGAVLLALSEAANYLLSKEPLTKNFYLTQGLLLVTLGLISKFSDSGLHLGLILATESVAVLMLATVRKSLVLHVAAYVLAALGVGWGMDGMQKFDPAVSYLGCGLGALMLANTLIAHRHSAAGPARRAGRDQADPGLQAGYDQPCPSEALLRPQVAYFVVMTLIAWAATTWNQAATEHFPLLLAAEGVLLILSIYVLRIRELSLLSQSYLILSQLAWVAMQAGHRQPVPWWNPLLLIALTLFLSHWWPRQKLLQMPSNAVQFCLGLYALGIVGVLYFWLEHIISPPTWLAFTGLLAVGLTTYAVATRAWLLGVFAQLFNLVAIAHFALQLSDGHPSWHLALAPAVSLALLSFGTEKWFQLRPGDPRVRDPLLSLALLYRWVALLLVIAWVWEYVPAQERIWVFSTLGLVAFAFAGWRRNTEPLLFVAVFQGLALALFWGAWPQSVSVYWPNLAAVLLLLAEQQVAKHWPERFLLPPPAHGAVIFIGGISLWLFCTRWVTEVASGFYLTASWSLLALAFFTCGIVARDRVYRWLGLGLLACALGRIVIFDVWRLEMLYRILSFMALGIVLLVLGFVYSKYQEKIKEWL